LAAFHFLDLPRAQAKRIFGFLSRERQQDLRRFVLTRIRQAAGLFDGLVEKPCHRVNLAKNDWSGNSAVNPNSAPRGFTDDRLDNLF